MDNHGLTYDSRDKILKGMGYTSYGMYLNSNLWSKIRRRVYAVKGSTCYLCPNKAEQLHHCKYSRTELLGKRIKNISPVCRDCHQTVEFEGDRKLNLQESREKFQKLRREWVSKTGIFTGNPALDIERKWRAALRKGIWIDRYTGKPCKKVEGRFGWRHVPID